MKYLLVMCLLGLAQVGQVTFAQRLISANGAVTEIIYALGAQAQLVGVDTTSTYPKAAQQLPNIGYQRALSLEGILSLRPNQVFITDEAGPALVLARLKQLRVKVVQLPQNNSPEGVFAMIQAIAKNVDRVEAAKALIQDLQNQLDHFQKARTQSTIRPKTLFMLSPQRKLSAGFDTKAQAMMDLIGLDNVLTFKGYKPLGAEALVAAQPEVILVMGTPETTAATLEGLHKDPAIAQTPAGKSRRVFVVDGMRFLGFGPRFIESASYYKHLIFSSMQPPILPNY